MKPTTTHKCQHCGGTFESVIFWARYCSPACKQAAYRQRIRKPGARRSVPALTADKSKP